VAPVIAYYASVDPRALWEAGGATALFIAGFGAAGYATRRDLTAIARVCFWALLALIVAGLVLTFVHIPGSALVYSVLGLVIFAGFTMFDFQRLRTNADITSAPFLAASIFLDVLNVFLFFLEIFSGTQGAERWPPSRRSWPAVRRCGLPRRPSIRTCTATASSATKKPALPGRLEGLTTNRSPKFLPPMQPTLRTGTGALLAAALAWLAP